MLPTCARCLLRVDAGYLVVHCTRQETAPTQTSITAGQNGKNGQNRSYDAHNVPQAGILTEKMLLNRFVTVLRIP
jgi:hypothetical protein